MKKLKVWLTDEDTHKDSNCVLLTFIGHGNDKGWLMDRDEKAAWFLEALVSELSSVETLVGKPKMLVMQSCRGCEYETRTQSDSESELR